MHGDALISSIPLLCKLYQDKEDGCEERWWRHGGSGGVVVVVRGREGVERERERGVRVFGFGGGCVQ